MKVSALVAFIIIGGMGYYGYHSLSTSRTDARVSNSPTPITTSSSTATLTPSSTPASSSPASSLSNVTATLQTEAQKYPDMKFGLSYIDLKTGQRTDIHGDDIFTAASTTKVLAATLFLHDVEKGTHSMAEMMGPYPAEFQLQQLINQSNNDSWDFFNDALGFPAIEQYAKDNGAGSYDSDGNKWSANGMATFLQALYEGKLFNKDNTALMLSYMQNTNEEGYIPTGLPSGVTVYHKTGLLDDNVHDGAIITDGTHQFVLVIYSNGQGVVDYPGRATIFHDIVQAVYRAVTH